MIPVTGHVAGLPVEELLLPMAYGAAAIWAATRAVTSAPARRARLAARSRLDRRRGSPSMQGARAESEA